MAIDIFSVQTLNRVLEDRVTPSSFLLDMAFPDVLPATSEEIYFDNVAKKRRLAPFVSPLREGQVVDMPGYRTHSFRPAYVKDKRVFEATMLQKRRPGEALGGSLSPEARMREAVIANLQDQLEMLTRREEWMASQALRLGQITVTGEGYPTKVVNFGRAAGHTVTLLTTARWGETGVSPLDNLKTWLATGMSNGGGAMTNVVMDPLAWSLFEVDPKVQALLTAQAQRGGGPSIPQEPYSGYQPNEEAVVIPRGVLGEFRFWTYQNTYQDESGVEQKMIPDYTVLMFSTGRLQGTRCYGYIKDHKANWQATRYFVKSWENEDPSVRFILMQSAPLVVPFRPNGSFAATVR
jgi:hypothetical protein